MRLSEYDQATRRFFGDAVNAVARASNPILGQIGQETVEVLATSVHTLDDGTLLENEPMLASASLSVSISGAVGGDLADVHVAIVSTADQFVASMMPAIYNQISDLCEATGNVTSAKDKPLLDAMLETIDAVEISFDRDGNPKLPTIVMHPDMAANLVEPTPEYQERFDKIIERKRNEWLAGRRTRRLPRPS
jgi:hypothetical protein